MVDYKDILTSMRELYDSGMTQQEIADKTGISRSYIRDLLSGKRDIDGLTLKKINQLFPDSALTLGNRSIGNNNTIGNNTRVQSDNNFLPSSDGIEQLRRTLINGIIDLDIDDTSRTKVLKLIKSIEL